MSQKMRKTLIMIVMAALIICLMAASLTYTFTYGRYAGGKFDEEKSPYDDLIEFVGANQYLVYSPEELIQAIKDGYSNIQIADEAEQPFVITEGVTDVTANLVLDVNGKTLIRNSRNLQPRGQRSAGEWRHADRRLRQLRRRPQVGRLRCFCGKYHIRFGNARDEN